MSPLSLDIFLVLLLAFILAIDCKEISWIPPVIGDSSIEEKDIVVSWMAGGVGGGDHHSTLGSFAVSVGSRGSMSCNVITEALSSPIQVPTDEPLDLVQMAKQALRPLERGPCLSYNVQL